MANSWFIQVLAEASLRSVPTPNPFIICSYSENCKKSASILNLVQELDIWIFIYSYFPKKEIVIMKNKNNDNKKILCPLFKLLAVFKLGL